jgi:hypothetical protein
MMIIDMTSQLGSLMAALDVVLVFAASAVAVSVWHAQSASFRSPTNRSATKLAVVGSSTSAPASAGDAPSDTSVSEAA